METSVSKTRVTEGTGDAHEGGKKPGERDGQKKHRVLFQQVKGFEKGSQGAAKTNQLNRKLPLTKRE